MEARKQTGGLEKKRKREEGMKDKVKKQGQNDDGKGNGEERIGEERDAEMNMPLYGGNKCFVCVGGYGWVDGRVDGWR